MGDDVHIRVLKLTRHLFALYDTRIGQPAQGASHASYKLGKVALLSPRVYRPQQVASMVRDDDRHFPLHAGHHADITIVGVHEINRTVRETPMQLHHPFWIDQLPRTSLQHQQFDLNSYLPQRFNLRPDIGAESGILRRGVHSGRDEYFHPGNPWALVIKSTGSCALESGASMRTVEGLMVDHDGSAGDGFCRILGLNLLFAIRAQLMAQLLVL